MNDKQGRPQLQERFQNAYDGEIQHIFMGVQHGFTGNAQNAEHGAGDHGPVNAPGGKNPVLRNIENMPEQDGGRSVQQDSDHHGNGKMEHHADIKHDFLLLRSPSPSA